MNCEARNMDGQRPKCVLAFDTSNEVIAIGIGALHAETKSVELVSSAERSAHRASNTQLLPTADELISKAGILRSDIACVCVGRGPGSFTGVRIAMATAKGVASALEVPLIGISTQESIAWGAWSEGVRGKLLVASDAMRKEIYPAYFTLHDEGVHRNSADTVVKATGFASEATAASDLKVVGDALAKYADEFAHIGQILPKDFWTPTGKGLLLCLQSMWRSGLADPFDGERYDPVGVLPVYTRLSDAEENERARLACQAQRNLVTGVQGDAADEIRYKPLELSRIAEAAELEHECMGSDAWSAPMLSDELPRRDRTWWMALKGDDLVGYAGGMVVDNGLEVLKIAVSPDARRRGIARELLGRIAYDGANLAAESMSLEVRESNDAAIGFYEAMGFEPVGKRPRYYSDGEAALIMRSDNMALLQDGGARVQLSSDLPGISRETARPLILAIESSCDETAASVIDGEGNILSNIVSSQIDFHARFGGVVPEIASRKHIEAIVGVCRLALEGAAETLGRSNLEWTDLDSVAVTYAPGLVGALVVGMAFAKGAAWAADVPIIGVNHLEGHLYANKLAEGDSPFEPPAIVSLLSGGNTMLVYMRDWQDYKILGATIDDAVGEAFDKVAKALGLPYPGGPEISRLAAEGNPDAVDFPRAMMHSGDYRFSLSGLKTAVITYINEQRESGHQLDYPDICASFQQAVIDVQVKKAERALKETGAKTLCIGGGVAANPALRQAYEHMCAKRHVRLIMPPLSACGDNAAMIALVALDRYKQGRFFDLSADAYAHADLEERY